MSVRAIVTAGGRLPRELSALHPVEAKALLPVSGRTLLEQALAALEESGEVGPVAVAGGDEVGRSLPAGTKHVPMGSGVVENILLAYDQHGGDERAEYLILSPDLPFVTGEAISSFIRSARASCELGVPLVSRDDFLAQFPGAPNFFEHIGGRQVTMGSALYVTGRMLRTNIPLWRDLYEARKFPLRLAGMLGLPVILAYIFRRLRIEALEKRVSSLHGGPARAIDVREAQIAYDIDNKVNYEYALKHAENQEDR
jgi:GTP:adenosylcobinamide-phosphate guanylyltransferase